MALISRAMIAQRIQELVAECDTLTPPQGADQRLWSTYVHALQQQLLLAESVATKIDVGERTGRFNRQTATVQEFAGAGAGSSRPIGGSSG